MKIERSIGPSPAGARTSCASCRSAAAGVMTTVGTKRLPTKRPAKFAVTADQSEDLAYLERALPIASATRAFCSNSACEGAAFDSLPRRVGFTPCAFRRRALEPQPYNSTRQGNEGRKDAQLH